MQRLLYGILFFTLLGVSTTPAVAQVDVKPGVRVGLNAATFRGDLDDTSRRFDFLVGGQLLFDLAGPLDIQTEAVYSRKGTGFDESSGSLGTTDDVTLKVDYFQINALGRLSGAPGPVSPFFFAGPYLGVEVSESVEASSGGQSGSTDTEIVKSPDFGLAIGAGLEAAVGVGALQFDLRYELGITNLNDVGGDETIANNTFVLGAALTF